jgi:hypothetical protein
MTRRKFIHRLIKAGSPIVVGVLWLAKNTTPRKFIRAFRVKKYPGHLKPLGDIFGQSKWSG